MSAFLQKCRFLYSVVMAVSVLPNRLVTPGNPVMRLAETAAKGGQHGRALMFSLRDVSGAQTPSRKVAASMCPRPGEPAFLMDWCDRPLDVGCSN